MPPSKRQKRSILPQAGGSYSFRVAPGPDASEQERTEYDIATHGDLNQSGTMALAQKYAVQPKNTKGQYAVGKRKWRAWCDLKQFPDGQTVHGKKVCLFLDEVCIPHRKKLTKSQMKNRLQLRERVRAEQAATASGTLAITAPPAAVAVVPAPKKGKAKGKKRKRGDIEEEENQGFVLGEEEAGRIFEERVQTTMAAMDVDAVAAQQIVAADFPELAEVAGIDIPKDLDTGGPIDLSQYELDAEGLPALVGDPVQWGTVDSYLSGISEIYKDQQDLGVNSHICFRQSGTFQTKVKSIERDQHRVFRETYADRGIHSFSNGYNDDQFLSMQAHLLNASTDIRSASQHYRTRLDILLGHFCVLRGNNRRGLELTDLVITKLHGLEGPTPCWALILVLRHGKTNQFHNINYMGAMRHKDPLLCTQGALAMYLFHRWDVSGQEPFPDFRSRRSWYDRRVLVGHANQPDEEMSYDTQVKHVSDLFTAVGLDSRSKTQAMRGCGSRGAELHGVCEEQVS